MFKRFPFYRQLDSMDCGPTCLRMVAAFHGREYPLSLLRAHSYIERDGVSLLGIVKAAETIGLDTHAFRIPWEAGEEQASLQDLELPLIAHWEQNNFVVVFRITSRYVWVGDPREAGVKKISHQEFLRGWCSVGEVEWIVLLLTPTPAFYEQDGDDETTGQLGFRYLLKFIKPYRRLVIQLLMRAASNQLT